MMKPPDMSILENIANKSCYDWVYQHVAFQVLFMYHGPTAICLNFAGGCLMHIEWPTAKQLPTWMIRPQQIDAVFGPGLCDGGLGPCNHHLPS